MKAHSLTSAVSKTVNNESFQSRNKKSSPKKHQQTVRFIAGHKFAKSKLKSSVALAVSEESINDDATSAKHTLHLESPTHVRMVVKFTLNSFPFLSLVDALIVSMILRRFCQQFRISKHETYKNETLDINVNFTLINC